MNPTRRTPPAVDRRPGRRRRHRRRAGRAARCSATSPTSTRPAKCCAAKPASMRASASAAWSRPESFQRAQGSLEAHFRVTDGDARTARGLHRHPARPVPREAGVIATGRMQGDTLRRRAGARQARRDLHAEGSRRQDGHGAQEARRAGAARQAPRRCRGEVSRAARTRPGRARSWRCWSRRCRRSLPLVGAQRGVASWMAVARPAAYAQLALVALAFAHPDLRLRHAGFLAALRRRPTATRCCRWSTATPRCGARTKVRCCCGR